MVFVSQLIFIRFSLCYICLHIYIYAIKVNRIYKCKNKDMTKIVDKSNIEDLYGQDLPDNIELTGIRFAGCAIPLFDHILEAV